MEITPSQISSATFKTSRKGYDTDEVRNYLGEVAKALEECRQHATAMEARARAAVARLQEFQAGDGAPAAPATTPSAAPEVDAPAAAPAVHVGPDEAETISRTLVLAQRTADTTLAEARAEADRIRGEANSEAESTVESSREMAAKLIEDAKTEARQASAAEREAAEDEVDRLKARRDFLLGDVDQLEAFLVDQRERLRGAARQIEALCERVPSGLGEVRPPVLSASGESSPDESTNQLFETAGADAPFAPGSGDGPAPFSRAADQESVDEPTQPIPMPVVGDDGGSGDEMAEASSEQQLPTPGSSDG